VEIFQVVYRAKFFDRGFFLRRDPQLSVNPQFIHFWLPQTESRPLESPEKMSEEVAEKVRRAYGLMTFAAPGMFNVTKALSYAGFSDEEAANRTIQMKLRRLLDPDKYGLKPKSTPSVPSNVIIGASCAVSSVDTASSKTARTPRDSDTTFSTIGTASSKTARTPRDSGTTFSTISSAPTFN
jgi:hypothetical protein